MRQFVCIRWILSIGSSQHWHLIPLHISWMVLCRIRLFSVAYYCTRPHHTTHPRNRRRHQQLPSVPVHCVAEHLNILWKAFTYVFGFNPNHVVAATAAATIVTNFKALWIRSQSIRWVNWVLDWNYSLSHSDHNLSANMCVLLSWQGIACSNKFHSSIIRIPIMSHQQGTETISYLAPFFSYRDLLWHHAVSIDSRCLCPIFFPLGTTGALALELNVFVRPKWIPFFTRTKSILSLCLRQPRRHKTNNKQSSMPSHVVRSRDPPNISSLWFYWQNILMFFRSSSVTPNTEQCTPFVVYK